MAKLTGGDKFEARIKEIAKGLKRGGTLRVGFFEKARYPDGTPVALVACFNEFGTAKAPPRPFFRWMISDKSPSWPEAIASTLKKYDYDAVRTLNETGIAIQYQLKEAISHFHGAPLAESTIQRKGHDQQLIDSQLMYNSVDFEVEEG